MACLPTAHSTTPPCPQAQLGAIPTRIKAPLGPEGAEKAAAAAVEAAKGLDEKLGQLRKEARRVYDRIYYGDVLPPVGSFQLSYARCVRARERWRAGGGRRLLPGAKRVPDAGAVLVSAACWRGHLALASLQSPVILPVNA